MQTGGCRKSIADEQLTRSELEPLNCEKREIRKNEVDDLKTEKEMLSSLNIFSFILHTEWPPTTNGQKYIEAD